MTSNLLLLLAFNFVLCLSPSNALTSLIPSGKEIIYDYNATINTGTYNPLPFASQFMLEGKLHMQHDEHSILMKFSDMTYKLYNGELNDHDEHELLPLHMPDEAAELMKPFRVMYDDNGQVEHITTDKNDRAFRQMKKAIASLMQLEMKQIKLDSKTHHAFVSHEENIYGKVQVKYNIMPHENEMVVDKMLDMTHADNVFMARSITDEDRFEDHEHKRGISGDCFRKYWLRKDGSEFYMNKLEAQGGFYMHPMKGASATKYMIVDQTMHMSEIIPMKEKFVIGGEETNSKLMVTLERDLKSETLPDITFGRREMNMDELEKHIYTILDKIATYLNINHLKIEVPDLQNGEEINHLYILMGHLDLATLEKMFATLEEKTTDYDKEKMNIFREMIPMIGTRATTVFVRNLIRKQKISDDDAVSMLTKLPFHLRIRNEKLLAEVEDLMDMDKVNPVVHRAAVMCFASLVNKVFAHEMELNPKHNDELLEKYIMKYMDKLKSAQDYATQYLYMNGLYNIEIGNVLKHLEPYVKGEATSNRHLRYLAMCASFLQAIEDSGYVYETYWPIFTDQSLHLEIRAAAYITIMWTKPCRTKLMDIYWVLENDPCPYLYHLHYTTMRAIVHSTETTLQKYKVMAGEILNFMRKPVIHGLTGNYLMDFEDPKFGFGMLQNFMIISTNTSKSLYYDFNTHTYNLPLNNHALWIKIDGLDKTLMDTIFNMKNIQMNNLREEIKKRLETLKEHKDLHVEYAVLKNNKIIELDYFDHTSITTNVDQFKMNILSMRETPLSVKYIMIAQALVTNDLGLVTVFEKLIPVININNEHHPEATDEHFTHHCDSKTKQITFAKTGLRFYNPIPDIWQGTKRVQTLELIKNLDITTTSLKDSTMAVTLNNMEDDTVDKLAMRKYTRATTFFYGDKNKLLQQSSKTSDQFMTVSMDPKNRKTKMLFDHDCPHTGLNFQVAVFDSDRHISRKTILTILESFSQKYFKNYEMMPLGYMFLTYYNSLYHFLISPDMGTNGFIIRATPSKKYPVDHIKLKIHFNNQMETDEATKLPRTRMDMGATLSTMTKDNQLIRSWDTTAEIAMNMGHTINDFKMQHTMREPEKKEWQMCIAGTKHWVDTGATGQWNITMGHNDGSETCSGNEGTMEIDMRAHQSEEQNEMAINKRTYDECRPEHMYEPILRDMRINYDNSVRCIMKKTTLRNYELDIKMSKKMKTALHTPYHMFEALVFPYSEEKLENNAMDENSMKITLDYPLAENEVNMEIRKNDCTHTVSGAPTYIFSLLGNYRYSKMFAMMYKFGLIDFCIVNDKMMVNDDHEVMDIAKDDWVQLVHNTPSMSSDITLEVHTKAMEDEHIALRMKLDNQILEIHPKDGDYKVTLNDKPLTVTKGTYHHEDMFAIGMLADKYNTMMLHVNNFSLYMDYDGKTMKMYKYTMDSRLTGRCF